jgi:hypothetical protein
MVNVFSFCIYGPPNPRYYAGLIENIELIRKYYPDWLVFVYVGADVPDDFITNLRAFPSVILRFTKTIGAENMINRFYAIDEEGVDVMMVRDADSRVHWKDRWAINAFMKNVFYQSHTVRDNIMHSADMMGGIWGMRKNKSINIEKEYIRYKQNPADLGIGLDQSFLSACIYPLLSARMLIHYGPEEVLRKNEHGIKFPFPWTNDIYCGRIEDASFKDVDFKPQSKNFLLHH